MLKKKQQKTKPFNYATYLNFFCGKISDGSGLTLYINHLSWTHRVYIAFPRRMGQ